VAVCSNDFYRSVAIHACGRRRDADLGHVGTLTGMSIGVLYVLRLVLRTRHSMGMIAQKVVAAEDYPSMKFFMYSFTIHPCSKHAN